ncbi:hypothetical protein Pcinc_031880 [Petrolisthes cinctipes]|uniref:Uncharacterized protein n=1 Tax=Petrolisthes cinctipes TaxID=88211 RepID=A0AAE1K2D3_PETCI|nr:hypothetical protein Pcinc_031880 [Petrolisthes cinctipes]
MHAGVDEMRGWGRVGDRALPSPRVVSLALQRGEQRPPLTTISLLVMQWGQFLDHDLVHTPEAAEVDETGETRPLVCCDDGLPTNNQDPAGYCRPIDVTADPLFTTNGRTCMRFVRSLLASMGCLLGPREQLNQITAYLDGSGVYGSTEEVARELREGSGGRLKTSTNPRLLPTKACEDTQGFCFKAGDERVNEQPGLASMHTLWLRVHQRLVTNLASVNPHWDDEKLYQEGRRIVSALIQQVTYREFLPIVLGDGIMQEFHLYPHDTPTSIPTYQPTTDPSIANAFATAAYRFGHTLVSDVLRGSGDKRVPLSGNFMDPHVLVEDGSKPSDLLLGLASSPSQAADSYLVLTLSNKLFAKPEEPVGLDLMSLNIQRGRDHGLPAYTVWRRACGLSDITSFPGLAAVMNTQAAHTLSTVYRNVNDVDLFPAGLSERSISGGLLGPTFSCLLAQQFSNIKEGDRFWYQNSEQPKPFTADQLGSLTRMSLASLMCHHLNLSSLQPNPFLAASVPGNEPQPCPSYPTLDLNQWKEVTDPHPRSVILHLLTVVL